MTTPDSARSAEPEIPAHAMPHLNVGSFRFWFVGQRWEWSDEVARMHGYEPGSVVPTTELLLSHKHPDDRQHVQDLLDHLLHFGGSFSSRHRFIDTSGGQHTVIVLADRMLDSNGALVGSEGYYIDLTDTFDQARRQALDDSLPELFEARAAIEQAKGALMLVYRISADLAFEILLWRSQQTNTKLRALAAQVVAELDTIRYQPDSLRREFDHLLLTVHDRVGDSPRSLASPNFRSRWPEPARTPSSRRVGDANVNLQAAMGTKYLSGDRGGDWPWRYWRSSRMSATRRSWCPPGARSTQAPLTRSSPTLTPRSRRPRIIPPECSSLELGDVTYFGSAGLNAVLGCYERGLSDGVAVRLVASNAEVIIPIEVTKLDNVLRPYLTVTDALDGLDGHR